MDSKLTLKPVELLDIGIDKLTKIPVPILNDNVTSEYNNENGVPINSFYVQFDSNYSYSTLRFELSTTYPTNITFDFGDGVIYTERMSVNMNIINKPKIIKHVYSTFGLFDVRVYGDLNKINRLFISPSGTTGGVISVSINNLKLLRELAITDSFLSTINIEKLIYLNNKNLYNNYLSNSEIDDLFNDASTFITTNGNIEVRGNNNGKPTSYSLYSINDLTINKKWKLSYNI